MKDAERGPIDPEPMANIEESKREQFLQAFLSSAQASLEMIFTGLEEGSVEKVRFGSHRLTGASKLIGADALTEPARRIENAAEKEGRIAREEIEQLRRAFDKTREFLENQYFGEQKRSDLKRPHRKILIIEDDPFVRQVYVGMLKDARRANFEAEEAETMEEGLQKIASGQFDLILLDLNLPDSEVEATVSQIPHIAKNHPIVVLTSQDDEELAVKAVSLGAQSYLSKGQIQSNLMIRAILYAIERYHLLEALEEEKRRSEDLIRNILPASVAEELMLKGKAKARHYDSATVMFVDFVSFTEISKEMPPQELIRKLDGYFQRFDEIIDKYRLEKIKTIGDAYMCAGGLPEPDPEHPVRIALAAFEIRDYVLEIAREQEAKGETPWFAKVGIHAGPLVAGVVGQRKFAYDIWGSTVNLAARMESYCAPSKINISQSFYEMIRDQFSFSERGMVKVKGMGLVHMYYLERPGGDEEEE